ncbi:MAG: DUF502 domain-containing protein [Burkholderiaceae bacterium]
MRSISRTILIGLLTAAPLIITWLIVTFLFDWLSSFGQPWVRGLAFGIRPQYPYIAELMLSEALQSFVAVLVVLVLLFLLGWGTGRVLGQRLIRRAEKIIGAIPVVDSIYRATKRFLNVASATPGGEKRVVLICFPSPSMKTVGLVTKMLTDSSTGEALAAVYIPTAPNPTSGYVEIVPVSDLVFLDWTFDQAMSFIVTGGSNGPDEVDYRGKMPRSESSVGGSSLPSDDALSEPRASAQPDAISTPGRRRTDLKQSDVESAGESSDDSPAQSSIR